MPYMNSTRKIASVYFIIQGAAGLLWWAVLLWVPDARENFVPDGMPAASLLAFWLADLLMFVGGSLACGIMLLRGGRIHRALMWAVGGAIAYATMYCAGVTVLTGSGWINLILMSGALAFSLFFMGRVDE